MLDIYFISIKGLELIMAENKKVSIVGLGYVGLPLAILTQNKGYSVVGIDMDENKIQIIKSGQSPFVDEFVSNWLISNSLDVTNDFKVVEDTEIIVVCVPTPVDKHFTPDLSPLISACTKIAYELKKGHLVIIESTINPGVCDEIVIPLLEKESGLTSSKDFSVAHCPERINPGDPEWHVGNIARIVGGSDLKSAKRAYEFYASIVDAPIKQMSSLKEAEAVKIVENSFRDINIAFVNELAMSFAVLGIDVVNVIDGASTKPFAFMPHYPGAGVGGHCIPVDPYYLIEYAKSNGFHHKFLATAREINNNMPIFTVDQVEEALVEKGKILNKAKVAVLGLSYKPNVGDLRESPSIKIIENLKARGAEVAVHDPHITDYPGIKNSFSVLDTTQKEESEHQRILRTLSGADAALLATAHHEYKDLTSEDLKSAGVTIVVDGRNCLDMEALKKAGITYKGVGR